MRCFLLAGCFVAASPQLLLGQATIEGLKRELIGEDPIKVER